MYLPTEVLLGTYGSSVRYHHEHGKYAIKYHVDIGPLRATCTLEFSDTVEEKAPRVRKPMATNPASYLYSLRRSMQTWLGSLELAFGTKSGYSQV